ncbi:MAG TPA: carboxypeptidase-like regulatory domain-containing protein [Gemmatimonadaceae bacterium]
MRRGWIVALFALGAAGAAPAQVVRGRVTEVTNAAPVPGALVSLLGEASDSSLVSVLTTPAGEYAVRAPAAGRYRLTVKRIGVQRFVSESFELAPGETRVVDVSLDAVALQLPQVTVSGLCVMRPRDLKRVASLWDEARTALEAAEIAARDRLIQTRITRYAAELEPSLVVKFDWRSEAEVLSGEPYSSISGDSLSAIGYWHTLPGDSVEFLAPDATALTSNAFLRDHCFGLAPSRRGRPDLVGLSFQPARDRRLPDIAGTIWLDARRFELRFIEFRYTMLSGVPNADRVGGEVHYARLGSGAWIVERWFIRMPQVIVVGDDWPRRQLREEGGAVSVENAADQPRFASITGVVRDSVRRPVSDAVVRAIGTQRQVRTGTDGSYLLDSLPSGGLSVVVHTDQHDAFGALADRRRVDLAPGQQLRLDFRVADGAALRREFCPPTTVTGYSRPRRVRSVLRLLMVDSATAMPLPGVRFLVSWPRSAEVAGVASDIELNRQALTDLRGAVTICDLPDGVSLDISVLGPGNARGHVMMLELPRNGFTGRVVMGRITRASR